MKDTPTTGFKKSKPTFKLRDEILYRVYGNLYNGTYLWKDNVMGRHAVLNKDGRCIFVSEVRHSKEEIELTLDQIAEKFGVDVKNLKIKK